MAAGYCCVVRGGEAKVKDVEDAEDVETCEK